MQYMISFFFQKIVKISILSEGEVLYKGIEEHSAFKTAEFECLNKTLKRLLTCKKNFENSPLQTFYKITILHIFQQFKEYPLIYCMDGDCTQSKILNVNGLPLPYPER